MTQTLEHYVHDALARVRDGQADSVTACLQEIMPGVIQALLSEGTAESSTVSHRRWALGEILALFGRVIRSDLRKTEAETRKARAIGKREASIAARQAAKNEGVRNQLKVHAEQKRFSRILEKARKEEGLQ